MKEHTTATATADPYGMTTKRTNNDSSNDTTTTADPYGMTTKEEATAKATAKANADPLQG
jgi:hypothetical protein